MRRFSRRVFAASGFAALGAGSTRAEQRPREITSASVPTDPIAPVVSEGTQRLNDPFSSLGIFSRRGITPCVSSYSLHEVRLLPSECLQAQEINAQYIRDLDLDRLLHNFRVNAGLKSLAVPLGGWEKPDCELRGHFVGHYLSAIALLYAATGDDDLRIKGKLLVAGLAECQDKLNGGYLSAFPTELFDRLRARKKVWAPFYTLHKIMAGLVDMHQLCANEQALSVVKRMADWTGDWVAALSEDQMQMVLDTEYGGMNDVLYLLADITGIDRYGTLADRFTKKRFFNPLANHRDELRGLHVNTHIPQVIGAARRYQMTGDRRFREVSDYFYQEVTTARSYATGGTSNNEGWLTGPNRLAEELKQGTDTTECCCAYNMMKLCGMLYRWTADARYFDYYERTLYNHRLGTVQPGGRMQYYLSIVPGAWRTFSTKNESFWCCDGTGVEEYSKLGGSIYFHDSDGIYVNLFIPSTLRPAKGMRLRQETRFPDEPRSRIIFETTGETTLNVRIPGWVAKPVALQLNGKQLEALGQPGSYVSLRRMWNSGDTLEIELPMELRYEAMPDDEGLRAILYGPLVLAGALGDGGLTPDLVLGPEGPPMDKAPTPAIAEFKVGRRAASEWLKPDGPLTFVTTGQASEVRFAPLHRTNGQRYSIYWRMT